MVWAQPLWKTMFFSMVQDTWWRLQCQRYCQWIVKNIKPLTRLRCIDFNGSARSIRVRIIERAGTKIKAVLEKPVPSPSVACGSEKCLPCKGNILWTCKLNSVVYSLTCTACEESSRMASLGPSQQGPSQQGPSQQGRSQQAQPGFQHRPPRDPTP